MVFGMKVQIQNATRDYLDKTRLAPSTRDQYARVLARWLESLAEEETGITGETPVGRLTIHHVEPFMASVMHLAPTTRRLYASALIGFYEFLELRELANVSSARLRQLLTPMINGRRETVQDYAADEVEAVIRTAETIAAGPFEDTPKGRRHQLISLRNHALVATLADTGLRISEAVGLRRGDVQWTAKPAPRAKVTGKGDKERWVFFSVRASRVARAYLNARDAAVSDTHQPLHTQPLFANHSRSHAGLRISTVTGRKIVRKLARATLPLDRVPAIHPHTFRHHFLTKVWRETGDLHLAQKLAGHASVGTTTRYTHASAEELAAGYARVFDVGNR
jgi:integrase/recombinase XerC